jgi:predicted ferric reductase
LRFFIRDLGDWTGRLQHRDLLGAKVTVEGPYGEFTPVDTQATKTVWVAGGVGITPFLSSAGTLPPGANPTLHYLVRSRDDAMALDLLENHHAAGDLELVVHASADGNRFRPDSLREHHGPDGLRGAHVAVCGPASLVSLIETEARRLGAARVEREDFDIRQGFGPDLSREIDKLTSALPGIGHR